MDLLKRRDEIVAEHRMMEKFHPHWKAEAKEGRSIGDRPVSFLCDDEVVVVGPCVDKVSAGLRKFLERVAEFEDRAAREPQVAQAIAKAKRATTIPSAEIRVSQQSWNAILFALGEVGVDVVLTDGKEHGGPVEVAGVQGQAESRP